MRHYEQIGYADSEAAQLYRGFLDRFMADWQRWGMADTFASPKDYFGQCVAHMAGMRLEGLNAIRANPFCVGHSMSGTFDHGFCGEGVMASEFRELKPGVTDAVFDGFYPLRLCLCLPSGGLMDYTLYRNMITDVWWKGLEVPNELVTAGIDASFNYDAGVLLAVYSDADTPKNNS
ncbi:MAG: hypothetical protein NTY19_31365 [Planctomycetota bacterium]|nr:hypothetical protein [Planctomycetota bacterium]